MSIIEGLLIFFSIVLIYFILVKILTKKGILEKLNISLYGPALLLRTNKGKKFFMVEQNSTAQLGQLIKEQVGFSFSEAILKYDGRPFYPNEIVESFKQYER